MAGRRPAATALGGRRLGISALGILLVVSFGVLSDAGPDACALSVLLSG